MNEMNTREIKQLIKALPEEERELLDATDRLRADLDKFGTKRREYRLGPPAGARRAQVSDEPGEDTRAVQLTRAR